MALASDGPAVASKAEPPLSYSVLYDVRLAPTERAAHVAMKISDQGAHVRSIQLHIDPERHLAFEGDGSIDVGPELVQWRPPQGGGTLRYVFRIDHLRDDRSYDARCAERWALFRGDDLVPPARVRSRRGARSEARLRLRAPQGWSVVTPYRREADGSFPIDHPERLFDRPTGWIVAGRRLGVAREKVAGVQIAVAAPVGHRVRRLDVLALLRLTLPTLGEVVGALPDKMLIVGAGDPMWRGGLSGPMSLYVHAARPLITTDGTSPLLHELVHTVMRARSGPGGDWITEGIAELYSLELLVRSRLISRKRYEASLARLEKRGRSVRNLRADRVHGPMTARAVTVLRALDRELRTASGGTRSLDDLVRQVSSPGDPLTTERFREMAEEIAGRSLAGFFKRHLPGDRARSARPRAVSPTESVDPDGFEEVVSF